MATAEFISSRVAVAGGNGTSNGHSVDEILKPCNVIGILICRYKW